MYLKAFGYTLVDLFVKSVYLSHLVDIGKAVQFVAVFQDTVRKPLAYAVDFHQRFGSSCVDILFGKMFRRGILIVISSCFAIFHPIGEFERRGYFGEQTIRNTRYLLEFLSRIYVSILCAKDLQTVDLLWSESQFEAFIISDEIRVEGIDGILFESSYERP